MSNNLNKKRKTWLPIYRENWFGDWFNPHESYLRLPSFWWPFTIIIIAVALVSWKVVHDQELVWGLDSRVEQWYEWFKIPLWVLALLIPVLGLFNANHKSEQAKESMRLTGEQNRFSNYYKHQEEFTKYCKRIEDMHEDNGLRVSARSLYSNIFPSARYGDFSVSEKEIRSLDSDIDKLVDIVKKLQELRQSGDVAGNNLSNMIAFSTIGLTLSNISKSKLSFSKIKALSLPDDLETINRSFSESYIKLKVQQEILNFEEYSNSMSVEIKMSLLKGDVAELCSASIIDKYISKKND